MGTARAELSSTGAVSVVSVLVTSSLKLGVFAPFSRMGMRQ